MFQSFIEMSREYERYGREANRPYKENPSRDDAMVGCMLRIAIAAEAIQRDLRSLTPQGKIEAEERAKKKARDAAYREKLDKIMKWIKSRPNMPGIGYRTMAQGFLTTHGPDADFRDLSLWEKIGKCQGIGKVNQDKIAAWARGQA